MGVSCGMSGILAAESHFWWQRKEKGERKGSVLGMRRGREVNVFSKIKVRIWERRVEIVTVWAHVGSVDVL